MKEKERQKTKFYSAVCVARKHSHLGSLQRATVIGDLAFRVETLTLGKPPNSWPGSQTMTAWVHVLGL